MLPKHNIQNDMACLSDKGSKKSRTCPCACRLNVHLRLHPTYRWRDLHVRAGGAWAHGCALPLACRCGERWGHHARVGFARAQRRLPGHTGLRHAFADANPGSRHRS